MNVSPPLNSTDDLRRLAMNAGTYGMVTLPARALLDLLGDVDVEGLPSATELRDLISDADRASWSAEEAASQLQSAASDLRKALDSITPHAPHALSVMKEQSR